MRHSVYRRRGTPIRWTTFFSEPSAAFEHHRRAGKIGTTRQARGSGLHRAPQIVVRMGVPSREPWAALSQDGGYLLRATPPLEKQACHPVIGDAPVRYRESPQ